MGFKSISGYFRVLFVWGLFREVVDLDFLGSFWVLSYEKWLGFGGVWICLGTIILILGLGFRVF